MRVKKFFRCLHGISKFTMKGYFYAKRGEPIINGMILTRDLRNITQMEFEKACQICKKIKDIVETRKSYIEKRRIDQGIALPNGNWDFNAANDFPDAYRFVVEPTYDVINRLRFYSQAFTGYQLMTLSNGYGTRSINPIPENLDQVLSRRASKPDSFVFRYIAAIQYLPEFVIARPPKIMGEVGWNVNGVIVNRDTYVYQERLNLLYEAGIINSLRKKVEKNKGANLNILEIGSGYGALAYYLKNIFPEANYYLCDIPEALLFSSLYLAIACPHHQYIIYDGTDPSNLSKENSNFIFVPNFMFDDMLSQNIKIDLAINTLSFSEMTEKQVRYYASKIRDLLGNKGILFEQNQDNKHLGLIHCKEFLPDYFAFRESIKPMTVCEVSILGQADIWANAKFSEIISPSLKPFK